MIDDDRPLEPQEADDIRRYRAAAHGVQSAIAFALENDPSYRAAEPKHMRTGVDMSFVQNAAVVNLLLGMGIITRAQWLRALADATEAEVAMRENEQSARTGRNIKFGHAE